MVAAVAALPRSQQVLAKGGGRRLDAVPGECPSNTRRMLRRVVAASRSGWPRTGRANAIAKRRPLQRAHTVYPFRVSDMWSSMSIHRLHPTNLASASQQPQDGEC